MVADHQGRRHLRELNPGSDIADAAGVTLVVAAFFGAEAVTRATGTRAWSSLLSTPVCRFALWGVLFAESRGMQKSCRSMPGHMVRRR